jgi:hypothetical protein
VFFLTFMSIFRTNAGMLPQKTPSPEHYMENPSRQEK